MNNYYYNETLNHRLKLHPLVLKAYRTYMNQKSRCSNKNIKSYKDYGAKGISVEYSSREFVGWYLIKIKNISFKDPIVGRIDHSKNYSFNNIKIEERSDNSKESTRRCAVNFSYPVIVKEKKSNIIVSKCKSMAEAARLFGNSFSTVQRQCSNKIKNPKTKYIYEYGRVK